MIMRIMISAAVLLASNSLFPQERIVFREKEATNITKLMENHLLFVSRIQDLDFDDDGNLYILDDREGNVVRVELATGALICKISSMGQGPAELMRPVALRIRNKKVFVANTGSIKIFSLSGEFLIGFRTKSSPRWFDVDMSENIYVAEIDRGGNPIISVYDMRGKLERTALKIQITKETLENKGEYFKAQYFKFKLDHDGNIITLHHMLRDLKKFNPSGLLLWERKIENPSIKPFLKYEGTKYDEQGRPTITSIVAGFDIDKENNIFIAHAGGGCIISPKGELIRVIEVQPDDSCEGPRDIRLPRISGDKLLGVFIGSNAILFPYRLSN